MRVGMSFPMFAALDAPISAAIRANAERVFPKPMESASKPPRDTGGTSFWVAPVTMLRYRKCLSTVRKQCFGMKRYIFTVVAPEEGFPIRSQNYFPRNCPFPSPP
jgi:hypothetical protein